MYRIRHTYRLLCILVLILNVAATLTARATSDEAAQHYERAGSDVSSDRNTPCTVAEDCVEHASTLLFDAQANLYLAVAPRTMYEATLSESIAQDMTHYLRDSSSNDDDASPLAVPLCATSHTHSTTPTVVQDTTCANVCVASVRVSVMQVSFAGIDAFVGVELALTLQTTPTTTKALTAVLTSSTTTNSGSSSSSTSSSACAWVRRDLAVLPADILKTTSDSVLYALSQQSRQAKPRRVSFFPGLSLLQAKEIAAQCHLTNQGHTSKYLVECTGSTIAHINSKEAARDVEMEQLYPPEVIHEILEYYTKAPYNHGRLVNGLLGAFCAVLCVLLIIGPGVMHLVQRSTMQRQEAADEQRLLANLKLYDEQQQQQRQ